MDELRGLGHRPSGRAPGTRDPAPLTESLPAKGRQERELELPLTSQRRDQLLPGS